LTHKNSHENPGLTNLVSNSPEVLTLEKRESGTSHEIPWLNLCTLL
jgi:hypothetical protein